MLCKLMNFINLMYTHIHTVSFVIFNVSMVVNQYIHMIVDCFIYTYSYLN